MRVPHKTVPCHPELFDCAQDKLREGSHFAWNCKILRYAQNDISGTHAILLDVLSIIPWLEH